jgi:hypothetical protein
VDATLHSRERERESKPRFSGLLLARLLLAAAFFTRFKASEISAVTSAYFSHCHSTVHLPKRQTFDLLSYTACPEAIAAFSHFTSNTKEVTP